MQKEAAKKIDAAFRDAGGKGRWTLKVCN